jgi:hypothetical protein
MIVGGSWETTPVAGDATCGVGGFEQMSIKVGDCVERVGGLQRKAGRVGRVWTEDATEFAEVWWTDGRNPTREQLARLTTVPDEECKRRKVPR